MTGRRIARVAAVLWAGWIASLTGPIGAQTLTFAPVGSIAGPADLIRVQGNFAYVAAGTRLTIFDTSNPAMPKRTGAYAFPEKIWGFRVVGSLVYVAADFFGLGILDVSDPAAPRLLGSFKTPGQAKNVSVSGTKAVLADHVSGVDIVDISDPMKPVSFGSVYLDGYARDVATFDGLAYAVDNPSGFYVLDLSKPNESDPMVAIQSAKTPRSIEVSSLAEAKDRNVAVLLGDGSLQVYDLSNPAGPIHAATYPTPGGGQRVSLNGTLAYIADGQEGLQVVDLSVPSKPTIVATYNPGTPVRDVAIAESLVYLIVGELPQVLRSRLGATLEKLSFEGNVMILRQTP
jgi:hypothetical protein